RSWTLNQLSHPGVPQLRALIKSPFYDYDCKVELALTSDGRTTVCPSVDVPYEQTKPIPRPDPVHNNEETHDQVLKTRLEEKNEPFEQGPMIEQLSKMFFTTKHRWYPRGQYRRRHRKLDPPKDR
uniref:Large ribosomal subunit protein mL42 n=1 Tax=Panthera tigris altaica TaxID=74533 RepID=A0A8C9JJW5_PANTA